MTIRFFDQENMSNGDDYTNSSSSSSSTNNYTATTNTSTSTTARTNCNCNVYTQNRASATAATSSAAATRQATAGNSSNVNNPNLQKSGVLHEIIGNCKEMRIKENVHNLRIVGNNNRVRINFNVGDITVIGNNTRLKIKTNHGNIKYTGNNGRICLGKDSSEQLVDYSGCNGVMKVENSRNSTQHGHDDDDATNNDCKTKNTPNVGTTFSKSRKSKSTPDIDIFKCPTDYANLYQRKKSLPNIIAKNHLSENRSSRRGQQQPKSDLHSFGNIVVANSSNVCIHPHSYYTY